MKTLNVPSKVNRRHTLFMSRGTRNVLLSVSIKPEPHRPFLCKYSERVFKSGCAATQGPVRSLALGSTYTMSNISWSVFVVQHL